MPAANLVPNIFVSPEDVVWQEPTNTNNVYTLGGVPPATGGIAIQPPSPVVPDLNTQHALGQLRYDDWRFTWMITAQQTNASNGASFEGNIVVFENRPFALDPIRWRGTTVYQAAGETVYEGVFGYSKNVVTAPRATPRLRRGADRTVLIRWTERSRRTPSSRSATGSPT